MIHIRFMKSEYEKLKKCAAYLNMPTARFVRQMSVQRKIKRYDLKKLSKMLRDLSSISNSFSQIRNVVKGTKDEEELNDLIARYEVIKKTVKGYFEELRPNKLF